jgi:hypothetical protein
MEGEFVVICWDSPTINAACVFDYEFEKSYEFRQGVVPL